MRTKQEIKERIKHIDKMLHEEAIRRSIARSSGSHIGEDVAQGQIDSYQAARWHLLWVLGEAEESEV